MLSAALFGLATGAAEPLADRVGRKIVLTAGFVFCIGQGISNLTVLGAAIFLAGIVMNGAQTAMPALAAQFYPTQGRATGVAWMLGIDRCGSIYRVHAKWP